MDNNDTTKSLKRRYKKISIHEINVVNPFIQETIQHVEKKDKILIMSTKNPELVLNENGDVEGHNVFAKRIRYDKAQFRKIYMSSLSTFFELSKSANKILQFIMINVGINQDKIIFDIEECKKATGYKSKTAINTGLSELIENRFIARSKYPYMYYINPTMFFNGDRITFLKQFDLFNSPEQLKIKSPINSIDELPPEQ